VRGGGNAGDLGHQLAEHGRAEFLEAGHRDHEGARPADNMVAVEILQPQFHRQDWQAIDHHPGRHRRVARVSHRTAAVVAAVAGHIDDAAGRAERRLFHHAHAVVDRPADRGAAAEQLPRRLLHGRREGTRRCLVGQPRPLRGLNLHAWPGPLEHHHGDGLRGPRPDGVGQAGRAERVGITLALQGKTLLADATRGIDRQHQQQVHFSARRSLAAKQQEQGSEAENAAPPAHLRPRRRALRAAGRVPAR